MPVAPIVEKEGEQRSFGAPQLSQMPDVGGAGEGIAQFGKQLGVVAQQAKERGDTVALLDASSQLDQWEQSNIYGPDGALAKKGKNAIGVPDMTGQQFDNDINAIGQNLANDDQRIAFQKLAQTRKSSMMTSLLNHERTQMDDYGKSVWKGKEDTGLDRAEANYNNDAEIGNTVADMQGANTAYMKTQGLSDEEIKAKNTDIQEKAYLRVLGKRAVTDPDAFLNSIKPVPPVKGAPAADASVDDKIKFVMNDLEGGAKENTDTGGLTKFGISTKGNPDVDVKNLDASKAQQLYKDRYWDAIGADKLPANMQLVAFDTAVNHGPDKAKEMIAQAGDDPQKLIDLRAAEYQRLATVNPAKYGDQLEGWNNRLAKLRSTIEADPTAKQEFQVADNTGTGPGQTMTDAGGGLVVPKDSPAVEKAPLTGNKMFDALPFNYQYQLKRLAETEVTKQRVQFRSDVEKRSKDALSMAQNGVADDKGVTPTEADFNKAYGDEGAEKFKQFNDLMTISTSINDVATQTPQQQAETLTKAKPVAGEGFAMQQTKFDALQKAVVQVNKDRAADPISFAQKYGLAPNEPLALNQPQQLAQQLPQRAAMAVEMHKTYGTPVKPLTPGEAQALSGAIDKMTPTAQLSYLKTFRDGLVDPQVYTAALGQIRPDSPVTAVAGMFVGLDGKQVTQEHTFSADETTTPIVVAQRLVEGEALLNPTKFDKKDDGKPSSGKVFPMPPDGNDESTKGLRPIFNSYVGDSFRGMPQASNIAYQSFRAYYAGEASRKGDYSGTLNQGIADQAARAVIGNVVDKGDGKTIAPWGMDETNFLDNAKTSFDEQVKANGFDPQKVKWSAATLENTGNPGLYRVKIGAGYLLKKDGMPMILSAEKTQ